MPDKNNQQVAVAVEEKEKAGFPSIVNVAMASANTEYKHKLPQGCKQFQIQLRETSKLLVAVVQDVVSAATPKEPRYFTVKSGTIFKERNLDIEKDTWLYLMTAGATKVAEIWQWT